MRQSILFLVPNFLGQPGGIARYCRLVCQALLQQKLAVTVVALADEAEALPQAAALFPGLTYLPCQGSRAGFIRQAFAAARRSRPSLVLVGHVYLGPVGWVAARRSGAALASFIYGIDAWARLPLLRRWALHQAHQVISISRFTAQQAQQANGISAQRVKILPNCLDPQFETPLPLEPKNGALSLLTVARMSLAEQYKGHDYVIRALPRLIEAFPHLSYNVVGDGDGRPLLADLVRQMGVAHAVRFHGLVSEAALQRHYAEASLFIMPSRAEGFGFVFLEAMAQGLPVIGGNLDASPEVIVDGQTGYLVEPTSVEAIATAASRLLADEALRRQMGQAGLAHVRRHFSFAQFQHQLSSYLAELNPGLPPERVSR